MNLTKIFRHLLITWLFLFINSTFIVCQDLIYFKDSTLLNVKIINFNSRTIIYQLPGDITGLNHYLSKLSVDSLRFSDGNIIAFTYPRKNEETAPQKIPRNYLELDMFNLMYKNPYLTYERLSANGRNSFSVGLLINFGKRDEYWYDDQSSQKYVNYEPYNFFVKIGYNHYPFNYSLANAGIFRVSAGASLNMGSYQKINWDDYYQAGIDEYKGESVAAFSLMGNTQCKLYLNNNFQIYAGLEFSVIPFLTISCPQIGLSIGF